MATIGNTYPSLIDVYKQKGADGQVAAAIIEMLAEINPILSDATVLECNDGTQNITAVRTGLPDATWRKLYQGVQPSKSTVKQVTDTTGQLEAWSEIDAKLVALAGDTAPQFRLNEAQAFLQGMSNEMAQTMFYGNEADDAAKFTGLAPRFNDLSAENGGQIIDAGGTGSDNTSIWMVVWGSNTVHGLYPKGSMAGLQRKDLGEETKTLADGSNYRVVREQFMWDMGLTVRDWRYVSRIANIDVSDMAAGTVDLYKFLRKAYYALYQRRVPGGRAAIYCNSDTMEALDALATNAGTTDNFVRLSATEIEGEQVMTYRGIPIREVDAILNTEARVV